MESYLETIYPHSIDNFAFIYYPQQKFICLGMTNGEVRVWADVTRLKHNKDTNLEYYELLNHSGPVEKIRVRFY